MTASLSPEVVAQYRRAGIHFPIDVLTADEAADSLRRLEAIEARYGSPLPARFLKPHLLFPWLDEIVRHPKILDAVESILGPNILCRASQFFAKNARTPGFVSWHQDATYWGLGRPDVLTAWVAFTPSIRDNGCMRVVPGTHMQQLPHEDKFGSDNMLTRGQEIAAEVDEKDAVDVVLRPGQMSLHDVLIVHGSEPNTSDIRRVGFAIRYMPTSLPSEPGVRDSATLVRGVDDFGYYDLERAPEADMHPDAVAHHKEVLERRMKVIYAGAAQDGRHQKDASATTV
ncbi:phytanoyl-CoA dioxygenase family protein [Xylophilus sp.]|uniref:phytanoyl-CoA dioxygenase family protein n=1 Tax=Xylophilus sp. TaxID=2653893 RepID=UPI0013BC5DFE|nr:phytanoyl-CoA dioxygenase family protein [Xylophilus sp.]KAF1050186.1 MAG: hypothetical protein GAK38_00212 [Xylophilus sp.]